MIPAFSSERSVSGSVRTTQIVVIALMMGLVIFAVIAVMVIRPKVKEDTCLAFAAVGVAGAVLAGRSFVGRAVTAFHRKQMAEGKFDTRHGGGPGAGSPPGATDGDRLLAVFCKSEIIQAAMMEVAGYLTLVAYLVTGQLWLLAVVALLAVLQLLQLPTCVRTVSRVTQQLELLELEKPANRTNGPA
jgi:hypothetical protein